MNKFGSYRESYLLERNALLSMYKNLDDVSLAKALPAAMALAVRRSIARTGTDASVLDLQRSPGGDDIATVEIDKMALTGPYAIDYFVEQLPGLVESRRDLQSRRRRSDRQLFPLFRHAIEPAYGFVDYLSAHENLVGAFGIAEHFVSQHRILVVTGEPLLERMAGPAIRAWEIASALSSAHDVHLVSTAGSRSPARTSASCTPPDMDCASRRTGPTSSSSRAFCWRVRRGSRRAPRSWSRMSTTLCISSSLNRQRTSVPAVAQRPSR